jgi:hypothetical protein
MKVRNLRVFEALHSVCDDWPHFVVVEVKVDIVVVNGRLLQHDDDVNMTLLAKWIPRLTLN